MEVQNLNNAEIPTDGIYGQALENLNMRGRNADISVFFRDQKQELIKKINEYPYIVGCVAWLTDFDILDALAKQEALIIVQKEDFLRPDMGYPSNWKDILREKYNAIRWNIMRYNMPTLQYVSFAGHCENDGIRCVGNYNSEKKPAFPRMHNKFLVFCEEVIGEPVYCGDVRSNEDYPYSFFPREVWTGSYNLTCNAENSFENAILINDDPIAGQFYREFAQIYALSEPLNWESIWMQPQFRIGS